MKIKLAVLFLLVIPVCFAKEPKKLWVNVEYDRGNDEVLFIEDLETGTRCYAISNSRANTSGYAIACVPKAKP